MRAILWPSMSYQDKLCPVLSTMMAGKYTAGGQVVTSPAVVNGVVYTGSCEQKAYAFNANTGSGGCAAARQALLRPVDLLAARQLADGLSFAVSYD